MKNHYRHMGTHPADEFGGERQFWHVTLPDGNTVDFTINGETTRARVLPKSPPTVNWCGMGPQPIDVAAGFATALACMARKAARLEPQR